MAVICPVVLGNPAPTELASAKQKAQEAFVKIQKHSDDDLIDQEAAPSRPHEPHAIIPRGNSAFVVVARNSLHGCNRSQT